MCMYMRCSPESDVAVHRKRHGVHELSGIRDQSKQRNSQELFIDSRPLQDNVDYIDKKLCGHMVSVNREALAGKGSAHRQ